MPRRHPFRSPWRRLAALAIAGMAVGLLAAWLALGDIRSARSDGTFARAPAPEAVDYSGPSVVNPRAYEAGRSIARATGIDRLAGCNRLRGEFRPGCRAFVIDRARAKK